MLKPTVSCFYITNYNDGQINITFIKYVKYIKIILNYKSIILPIEQLITNYKLFQIYLISLLLTENTTSIDLMIINKKKFYGISTMRYWKNVYLTLSYKIIFLQKSYHKNPFYSNEPKRSTSLKKINKFMRTFYNLYKEGYIINPLFVFYEYYSNETLDISDYVKKQTEHNKKIEILINILHNYGHDIYYSIKKYLF
jgi:hypothetical protein